MSDRLFDLEGRYMHLEKLVEQLNEVVIGHQGTIDRMVRELAALREQLSSGDTGPEPPPPHY